MKQSEKCGSHILEVLLLLLPSNSHMSIVYPPVYFHLCFSTTRLNGPISRVWGGVSHAAICHWRADRASPSLLHLPASTSRLPALMHAVNMQVQLVFRAHMGCTNTCGIGHTKVHIMQNHARAYKAKDP